MAELRNIKWGKLAKALTKKEYLLALAKSRSLQWWLTLGLRDLGYLMIDDTKDLVLEYKGIKFYPDVYNYARMFEAWDRYRIDRIRPTDVVLDLGANIGSFTLPAAKRAKEVYAIEPIYYEQLRKNIELNGLQNICVLPLSIGSNKVDAGLMKEQVAMPEALAHILGNIQNKVDVLRMDIGGAEWQEAPPQIFKDVRQFELELHFYKNRKGDIDSWKEFFIVNKYNAILRWSKHKHWLYVSAEKADRPVWKECQLKDGSFKGESLGIWKQ